MILIYRINEQSLPRYLPLMFLFLFICQNSGSFEENIRLFIKKKIETPTISSDPHLRMQLVKFPNIFHLNKGYIKPSCLLYRRKIIFFFSQSKSDKVENNIADLPNK